MNLEEIEEEKWWEEEKEKELERLRPSEREMIILNLVIRTSDGYYNYKSIVYAIFKEPEEPIKYEDSYVIDVRTKTIYCGVYQLYNCFDVEEAFRKLEAEGYEIVKIFEA